MVKNRVPGINVSSNKLQSESVTIACSNSLATKCLYTLGYSTA